MCLRAAAAAVAAEPVVAKAVPAAMTLTPSSRSPETSQFCASVTTIVVAKKTTSAVINCAAAAMLLAWMCAAAPPHVTRNKVPGSTLAEDGWPSRIARIEVWVVSCDDVL